MIKKTNTNNIPNSIRKFSYLKRDDSYLNLLPKYNFMGYSNLNFYKILSKNDTMMLKQSSKIFQSYSPLYNQSNNPETTNNKLNMNKNDDLRNNNFSTLIKCLIFEDIQNPFSEDIVFNGNTIGKIEGLIEIKKIPLIKQIMCGVHTENGFDISSIFLHNSLGYGSTPNRGPSNKDFPNELRNLILQKNNLLDKFFPSTLKNLEEKLMEKNESESNDDCYVNNNILNISPNRERRRNQAYEAQNQNLFVDPKTTLSILNEIRNTLKKSCKESVLIYNLVNEYDILLAQREMIDLGINLINILTKEDLLDTRRTVVFDILMLLFNRGEIGLRLMAFEWKSEPSIEKLEVCRDFIELLNKTLAYCLEKLAAGKSADLDTNEFVEFFLSVGYFRIPLFRKIFLNTISKDISESESREILKILDKEHNMQNITIGNTRRDMTVNMIEYTQLQDNDKFIEDARKESSDNNNNNFNIGIKKSFNLEGNEEFNPVDINPVNYLIDWETLFYDRIDKLSKNSCSSNMSKEIQEISEKIKESENIIQSLEWKERISKRGNAFFSMIFRLEKYIQSKVIILRNLRWAKIPGFKFIINAIIHELKRREVAQYQEPLVRLVTIFINDSDISNLFIDTIIRKTK